MKTIHRTVTEEVAKTISTYKAYDGRLFDNAKECWDYEEEYRSKVNRMLMNTMCLEATAEETGISFDDEEMVYFIIPKSKKDIILLNVVARWHNADESFTEGDIGKMAYICVTDIRDAGILEADYITIGRWDEYVKSRNEKWMELERMALRNQILVNDKNLKARE